MASIPAPKTTCVTKVELRIRCRDLVNKDLTSKSDPIVALYVENRGTWIEVGRTEHIKNTLNPDFTQPIEMDYYFEEVHKLKVAVYDIDNVSVQLDDDDFLGMMETTLGQVVSGSPYTKPLMNKKGNKAGRGTVCITAEEIQGSNDVAVMTFQASKLDKKDFLGKSDPFLEISKHLPDGTWQPVHRTEVIKNNLSPTWRTFGVPVRNLCGNDPEQVIKLDCYDWDGDGSHDLIGAASTTWAEISKGSSTDFPLVNPKKQAKKKNYQNSGVLHLSSCKVEKLYSFLDFIFGGLQINCTVGIDFTGSNGNPLSPSSLHYINPYEPNEYMQAISSVGAVCQDYDSDKFFPVLGFGAKIPPDHKVSHEFPINFNAANPFCQGTAGILDAYRACVPQIQFHGPTNVAPIIYHVAQFASQAHQDGGAKNYYVLLLLTDGVLSDMREVREAICYASGLPMSIIIVGVGLADFSDMNALDGDDGVLRTESGKPVQRDIVQFVPFRNFKGAPPPELARNVLAEVPSQVTQYYKMRGLTPLNTSQS